VHEDLFAQAEILARLDAKKPKQVNLRRSVSAAYYADFHYLTHEACCIQFGTQHAQAPYRSVIGRAFAHSAMKAACNSFGGGTLKESVIKALPRDANGRYLVHPAIRDMATTFADLQEKRQRADYDRSERFKRSEVLLVIEQAKDSVAKFSAMPVSDDKKFFVACLWAWKEVTNR
jgi:uncharacterized protein (UPF0332 family)